MPVGHIGINVSNLEASYSYYSVLMPLLSHEPFLTDEDQFAFRPADNKRGTYLFFYAGQDAYHPESAGLQHLAFMVPTRLKVDEVTVVARDLGSEIIHLPQEWPDYPPPYYASFWTDPDGIMLEAVCHK
ncbi:MAG: extradiol dioxygenase [Acidimicrobiaceae bacterium]|nr:extradiol dioxygenase [Acidimicrobiaceae bacterium]|tara:strand:+ start:393 stop:779 length:387 start_codon:yes stop_codon:yes gene_type:complete